MSGRVVLGHTRWWFRRFSRVVTTTWQEYEQYMYDRQTDVCRAALTPPEIEFYHWLVDNQGVDMRDALGAVLQSRLFQQTEAGSGTGSNTPGCTVSVVSDAGQEWQEEMKHVDALGDTNHNDCKENARTGRKRRS